MAVTCEVWKEIRDAVHGQIELHPLAVAIIDTPEFQRLRNISQCGLVHFVYPSACHSRFEHSLGVYHLAGVLLKRLEEVSQPIDRKDKLAVQVAALCHDIGHGPFSHSWERFLHSCGIKYKHEKMSGDLLDYIIENNGLQETFDHFGIDLKKREFIKRLIDGKPDPELDSPSRKYLFEIVANNDTGVDVDKWDYILRDALHLGVKTDLNYERILTSTSIVQENGIFHIGFRDKVARNIEEMFKIREKLHQICYQHKTSTAIDIMLIDALLLADQSYKIKLENGKEFKMSECHTDLGAYVKLTDSMFYGLLNSVDMKHAGGRDIIKRIVTRKLYTFICDVVLNESNNNCDVKVIEDGVKKMKEDFLLDFRVSFIDVGTDLNKLKKIKCFDKNRVLIEFPCELVPTVKKALLFCTSCKDEIDASTKKEMEESFRRLCSSYGNCSNLQA